MVAFFIAGCGGFQTSSSLEMNITDLKSRDFHKLRQAQSKITAEGQTALPKLSQVARSSDNEQQVALCCYLIGTIDKNAYKTILIDLAIPEKLCTVLRYPCPKAISSLSQEQRREIESHFASISAALSKDEAACIAKLTQGANWSHK